VPDATAHFGIPECLHLLLKAILKIITKTEYVYAGCIKILDIVVFFPFSVRRCGYSMEGKTLCLWLLLGAAYTYSVFVISFKIALSNRCKHSGIPKWAVASGTEL